MDITVDLFVTTFPVDHLPIFHFSSSLESKGLSYNLVTKGLTFISGKSRGPARIIVVDQTPSVKVV